MENNYQERHEEFSQSYTDCEGEDLVSLVIATGEWLERLLIDRQTVETIMVALYCALSGNDVPEEFAGDDWRQLWSTHFNDCNLKSTQLMTELNAYGFWGLRPDSYLVDKQVAEKELIERIGFLVAKGRALIDAIPAGWGSNQFIGNTVLAAEARFAIDAGHGVTPAQLAELSKLSLKSVKNLLAPGSGVAVLNLDADGKIPSADAKRWLEARSDFRSSIWHMAEANELFERVEEESDDLDDVIFVPATKDGNLFDPKTCRRAHGYTIGKKGSEVKVEDYRSALDRLSKMPTPQWRRPNALGNWGIVSGVSWQRKTLAELGLATNDGGDA